MIGALELLLLNFNKAASDSEGLNSCRHRCRKVFSVCKGVNSTVQPGFYWLCIVAWLWCHKHGGLAWFAVNGSHGDAENSKMHCFCRVSFSSPYVGSPAYFAELLRVIYYKLVAKLLQESRGAFSLQEPASRTGFPALRKSDLLSRFQNISFPFPLWWWHSVSWISALLITRQKRLYKTLFQWDVFWIAALCYWSKVED